ncbi:MAG: hypothetical protein IJW16_01355 [Clostridia bacterium]|nr:hypothetical protein [Clostridia bacterium]
MEFERAFYRRSVREGYVVLLRAEAELLLPVGGYQTMRAFYEKIVEACMNWVVEIYGEEVRRRFLSLESIREKSRFRTQSYRFFMRSPWQEEDYLTLLCESERSSLDGDLDFYRICHTWNCREETVLPPAQCRRLFGLSASKGEMPFVPDGFYRENGRIVIYKNKTSTSDFMEVSLPQSNA